ncbi:hypothetical protein [Flavihumibacter sp. ZG627]|uniref:hypothetical protein n=1 Tax=Flavihumibacter sp. ZG627 TaxID=1463156 RepID=UPI0005802019|nr:hypothetical protein [Flavihumibacter sp. ZG627]
MYNPEAAMWPEGYFSVYADESLLQEVENISDVVFDETTEENDYTDDPVSFIEDFPDDDNTLLSLVNDINLQTIGMSDDEVESYMQDRLEEFWPALLAALPAVIQLAPQVINAVSSLVSKPAKQQPAATHQKQAPAVKPATIAKTISRLPPRTVSTQPNPKTSADPQQLLNAFNSLAQSPVVQQLLSNLAGGNGVASVSAQGTQVSASNVLGVLSGLAASLADASGDDNSETVFPEYTRNTEGRYLIDPFDVYQEAELILDLLNS